MLADLFAPANRITTLLCIAALVLVSVVQYRLCLASVRGWLQKLPILLCSIAAAVLLVLAVILFYQNPWYGLSCFLAMVFALLLVIACAIARAAAHHKQRKNQK